MAINIDRSVQGNIIEAINWQLTNLYDILIDFEKLHSAQKLNYNS